MTNEQKAAQIHEKIIKENQKRIEQLQDMNEEAWKRIEELDPTYFVKILQFK